MSARAAHTLQEKGIDARVLEHDLHSWRDTGRPLAVGPEPYSPPSPSPAAQ